MTGDFTHIREFSRQVLEFYRLLDPHKDGQLAQNVLELAATLNTNISAAMDAQSPQDYFTAVSNIYRSVLKIYELLIQLFPGEEHSLATELKKQAQELLPQITSLVSSTHLRYRINKR